MLLSFNNGPQMNNRACLLIVVPIALIQGCSADAVTRTSYETLQNLREQQCDKDLSGRCPSRESYDDYQRKRQEARTSE